MSVVLIDIISIAAIGILTLLGLFNGLIKEFFSILAWIGSLFIAWNYSFMVMPFLEIYELTSELLPYISFLSVFITCFILLKLAGKLTAGGITILGIGSLDKVLGGCFGFLKAIVILTAVCILMADFLDDKVWWKDSYTKHYTFILIELLDPVIPEFNGNNLVFSKKENVTKQS